MRDRLLKILEKNDSLCMDVEKERKKLARAIANELHLEVVVEVSGGVAHLVEKPKGVEVVIRDYDNEEEGGKCPEDVYESDVEVKGVKKPKVTYSTTAYVECDGVKLSKIKSDLGGYASGPDNFCTTVDDIQAGLDDFDIEDKTDEASEIFLKAVLKEVSGKAGDVIFHR